MRRSPLTLLLCCLAACGGGDSPLDRRVGEGRIVRQVGPGGGVLRGGGGTALQGFLLEIPEGALTRLVDITVEPAADIAMPDSVAASTALAIRAEPDPGVLLRPAVLKFGLDLPLSRRPEDLFVAGRPATGQATVQDPSTPRRLVLADFGSYDHQARVFTAPIRTLTSLQVRLAERRRLTDDAFRLVQRGYEALARLTSAGIAQADGLFAEAQRADPFLGAPNLFRALSRVLVVLDARDDTGPGLDSIGEALQRLGIDVGTLSLVERYRTGSWPQRLSVPEGAPRAAELLELLRVRLRPAIQLALGDLDRVPATTELVVSLPAVFPALPGDREVDATDVVALRALLTGIGFAVEHLGDFDLDVDLARVAPRTGVPPTLREVLDEYPRLGALTRAPDGSTDVALRAVVAQVEDAFRALDGEDDDQGDDLLVFPAGFDLDDRAVLGQNLRAIRESLERDEERRVTLQGGGGSLPIRIGGPWRAGALSPRDLAPALIHVLPVAGTLPDPTAGGLFPGMTQDRATDLLGLVDLHATPTLPIVADGALGDWTAAAEALAPADPLGDVAVPGLRAIDLWRVWFAESDDELALRIAVADGAIGYRADQATVYGMRIRDVGPRGFGAVTVVDVFPTSEGFEVRVTRGGVVRPVRSAVGVRGSDLEVTLNRFDLLDPDEPVADRAVDVHALALDLETGASVGDRTRAFVVRF